MFNKNLKKRITVLENNAEQSIKDLEGFKESISTLFSEKSTETEKRVTELCQHIFEEISKKHIELSEKYWQNNLLEINKLKQEQDALVNRTNETNSQVKIYIDNKLRDFTEEIKKTNLSLETVKSALSKDLLNSNNRITVLENQLNNLNTKVDILIKDTLKDNSALKERIIPLENIKPQLDMKVVLVDKDLSAIKEHLDKIVGLGDIEKKTNDKIEVLNASVITKIDNTVNQRIVEYQHWINQEYYSILDKVIAYIKILIAKSMEGIDLSEIEKLKEQLIQKTLEESWAREKELKGQEILNRGAQIIEKRQLLHNEMIEKEKQGQDVSRLKIKIDAYDEIIKEIAK